MATHWVVKNSQDKPRQVRTERATVRFLGKSRSQWSGSHYNQSTGEFTRKLVKGKPIARINGKNIRELAQLLRDYHSIRLKRFGRIGIKGQPRKIGDYRDAAIYYSRLMLEQLGKRTLSTDLREQVQQLLRSIEEKVAFESSFSGNKFSLIHRDLHPFNIVKSRKRINLIDWGSAASWDPALDIALFFAKNGLRTRQMQAFMRAYVTRTVDPAIQERIKIYLPLAYLSLGLFTEGSVNLAKINHALRLVRAT